MATNEDENEAPPAPVQTPFGGYPSTLEVIQEEPSIAPSTPGCRKELSDAQLGWLAGSAQRKLTSAQQTRQGMLTVHANLMADEAKMTDVVIYGAPERHEQEM